MTIYENPHLTVQWRFPRTRKRRIRNKWAKRPENRKPDPRVYYMAANPFGTEKVVCHPAVAREVRRRLEVPPKRPWGCHAGLHNTPSLAISPLFTTDPPPARATVAHMCDMLDSMAAKLDRIRPALIKPDIV